MSTSGTTAFNLDLNNLIEEAFERCGAELRTGYDFRTAKRSLGLLLMDWANRGINLWTLETGTKTLTYNVGTYDLDVDTVDLLDHVIRTGTGTNQQDINISRISSSTYLSIPNKNATGRPIQVWINRQSGESNPTTATMITSAACTSSGSAGTRKPSDISKRMSSSPSKRANWRVTSVLPTPVGPASRKDPMGFSPPLRPARASLIEAESASIALSWP